MHSKADVFHLCNGSLYRRMSKHHFRKPLRIVVVVMCKSSK